MNILSISTLYNKGGAADIARTLHEGFNDKGFDSSYLAGYSDRFSRNDIRDEKVYFAVNKKGITTFLNYLSHKVIGKDFFSPNSQIIEDLMINKDIIICHTLHSHWLNFENFFRLLKKKSANKRILFVAHDSWHYTGRCAIINDCTDWQKGCIKCEHTDYYPSTLFSISKIEYQKKINLIKSIPNLEFISPSKWICEDLKRVYPNTKVSLVRNGIDTSIYNNIKIKEPTKDLEFCVSCVDISQNGKVDLNLIEEILKLGLKIHFIGKNNPFQSYPNAINHGYISDKDKYIDILSKADCYLFTSKIDSYATTVIEAICAGNLIMYTKSKGAYEIMNSENKWLGYEFINLENFKTVIKSDKFKKDLINLTLRKKLQYQAFEFYSIDRLVKNYENLF
ncbi:MAG: hypothetical protein VX347_03930 [Bacteroidota bacterium]|nr:hypothetical protein [Bacteroidota bacterium]